MGHPEGSHFHRVPTHGKRRYRHRRCGRHFGLCARRHKGEARPANRRGLAVSWPGDAIAWRVIAGVAAPRDMWGRRPFPAPSLHALHFPKFYPCTPILSLALPCTPCPPRPHFHSPHDPPSWPPHAPGPRNSSPRLFACPHLHHFPAAPRTQPLPAMLTIVITGIDIYTNYDARIDTTHHF